MILKRKVDGAGLMHAMGIKQPQQQALDAPQQAAYVKPRSRRGRAAILTYHDPAVAQQLKTISFEKDITQQKLVAEALNMLFAKYGKGQIA